jgi:hypothetical protein
MPITQPTYPTTGSGIVTHVGAYVDALDMLLPLSRPGTLAVGAGVARFPLPYPATIVSVQTAVGTAPTGASLIVDVNKNGTTIFSTQGNRPTIAAAGFLSGTATPNTTAMTAGDYFTIDVDQVGSTIAGADLTVIIRLRRP